MNIAITYISRIRTRPHPNRDGFRDHLPPGTLGDRNHDPILPRIDGEVWSLRRDWIRTDGSDRPVHVQLHREEGSAGFPRGADHRGLFKSPASPPRILDIDRDSGHNQFTHLIHSGNGRVHPMSVSFRHPALCRIVLFFRFLCPLCWIRRVKAHSWICRFSSHLHVCRGNLDSFILFRQGRDSACL